MTHSFGFLYCAVFKENGIKKQNSQYENLKSFQLIFSVVLGKTEREQRESTIMTTLMLAKCFLLYRKKVVFCSGKLSFHPSLCRPVVPYVHLHHSSPHSECKYLFHDLTPPLHSIWLPERAVSPLYFSSCNPQSNR